MGDASHIDRRLTQFSTAPYGIFHSGMVPRFLLARLFFALSLVMGECGAHAIRGPAAWSDLRVVFSSENTWQRVPMDAPEAAGTLFRGRYDRMFVSGGGENAD